MQSSRGERDVGVWMGGCAVVSRASSSSYTRPERSLSHIVVAVFLGRTTRQVWWRSCAHQSTACASVGFSTLICFFAYLSFVSFRQSPGGSDSPLRCCSGDCPLDHSFLRCIGFRCYSICVLALLICLSLV